jgi:hypothetical protein
VSAFAAANIQPYNEELPSPPPIEHQRAQRRNVVGKDLWARHARDLSHCAEPAYRLNL